MGYLGGRQDTSGWPPVGLNRPAPDLSYLVYVSVDGVQLWDLAVDGRVSSDFGKKGSPTRGMFRCGSSQGGVTGPKLKGPYRQGVRGNAGSLTDKARARSGPGA